MRRRNKYNAKKTIVDGIKFDSKMEAERYAELKLMQKAGEIRNLEVHPRYPMFIGGQHICFYEADFGYRKKFSDPIHVEDVKGVRTALFILKKKLMLAIHGILVKEIRVKKRR